MVGLFGWLRCRYWRSYGGEKCGYSNELAMGKLALYHFRRLPFHMNAEQIYGD
jgi:hypothetical protein